MGGTTCSYGAPLRDVAIAARKFYAAHLPQAGISRHGREGISYPLCASVFGVGPRQPVEENRLSSKKRPSFGLRTAFLGPKVSVQGVPLSRSLRFDPCRLDHPGPLGGFIAYLPGEFLRRAAHRHAAVLRDARDDVRVLQHGDGFLVP